jgi:hypothetical protein
MLLLLGHGLMVEWEEERPVRQSENPFGDDSTTRRQSFVMKNFTPLVFVFVFRSSYLLQESIVMMPKVDALVPHNYKSNISLKVVPCFVTGPESEAGRASI